MNRRSASDRSRKSSGPLPALVLGLLTASVASPLCQATPSADSSLEPLVASAVSSISREKSGALVVIHGRDLAGEIIGTGFQIDPSGTICTLSEFLRGDGVSVIRDGKEFPASMIAIDSRTGVAFLRLPTPGQMFLPPLVRRPLPEGAPLVVPASPAPERPPCLGLVRGTLDHEGGTYFPVPLTTASLPASSTITGSPATDLSGNLVGMVVRAATPDRDALILPVSALGKLHDDLMRFGHPSPGWIGVAVEEAAVPDHGSRTRIAAVEQGSPASLAGITPGEILLSIGNHPVPMPHQVLAASFDLSSGDTVSITLSRGGELRTLCLQCAPWPGTP